MVGHAPRERVSWNFPLQFSLYRLCSHAPRERVSWNPMNVPIKDSTAVTLHVSVWVEIIIKSYKYSKLMSRSTWACELKYKRWLCHFGWLCVTLHVSVWVEIKICQYGSMHSWSRSTWACELKFNLFNVKSKSSRHAPRERVSWNKESTKRIFTRMGHAPRERVSWNE